MFKVLAIALVASSPAHALSCLRQNFADDFNRIAAAEELYSIGFGTLVPVGDVPKVDTGKPRSVDYRFEGTLNFRRGDSQVLDVTVNSTCVVSWCGGLPEAGVPYIAYMEHRGAEFHIKSQACSSDMLWKPSLGQVTALRTCLRLGECGPEELAAFE